MSKKAAAATLSLLGKSEMTLPASPAQAKLEVFPNPSRRNRYTVQFECAEFTSMCPVTGQPDFGQIRIEYQPGASCVETKSLKFYLASFRNEKCFCETVTNRILDDFVAACSPRWVRVSGTFASRGGIRLTVEATHGVLK